MGSEFIAHEADSEAMRARGIIALVEFHWLVKMIETNQL